MSECGSSEVYSVGNVGALRALFCSVIFVVSSASLRFSLFSNFSCLWQSATPSPTARTKLQVGVLRYCIFVGFLVRFIIRSHIINQLSSVDCTVRGFNSQQSTPGTKREGWAGEQSDDFLGDFGLPGGLSYLDNLSNLSHRLFH